MNLEQAKSIKEKLRSLVSTRVGVNKNLVIARLIIAPSRSDLFAKYIDELALLNLKDEKVTSDRFSKDDLDVYFLYVSGGFFHIKKFTDFLSENGIMLPTI